MTIAPPLDPQSSRRTPAAWLRASLQRQVLATLALVLVILSALTLAVVTGLYRARISDEQERAALQVNSLLQAALENAMLKRDLPGLRAIVADLGKDPSIVAVRVLNPDLVTRFASDPAMVDQVLDLPEFRVALESRVPQAVVLRGDHGQEVQRSINPVSNKEPCQVCHGQIGDRPVNGLLVVDYDTGGLNAEARRTSVQLAVAGLAITALALQASFLVLRRKVLQPLGVLAEGTRALAEGQLGHRIPLAGSDEPARLAASFNHMAGRLERAVQRLNSAGALLQAVIDAIPDGIRVIGPDYRILIANTAFAAQARLPREKVPGLTCHSVSYGRDTPCPETLILCPLAEARAGRLPMTCRQTHLGPDGTESHVEVAAAAITLDAGDGPAIPAVIEAIRDLGQQARLSQEQRLSELGLLAAGLAHEIHNPLSSISLLLEAARDDIAEGREAAALGRVETIGAEVERTLKITNSLLSLCLPPNADPVLVEIDRVVPEALAILSFQARQSGCTQEVEITPGLRFLGSESDLRMLVTNLALNAFHAMPEGGIVQVRGWREGGEIVLSIADQGIGIPAADQARIFLPFWTRRADGSPGRGLGLSIVQAVVTRWSGSISVDSAPGKGTTFTVRLPDPDSGVKGKPA